MLTKRLTSGTALATLLLGCAIADDAPTAPFPHGEPPRAAQPALNLGYGPDLFYYLRHDASTFSTFGTISTAGTITDRFGVGNSVTALTFAAPNVGYGGSLFYALRQNPATGISTITTISTNGTVTDRFGVGSYVDALTFAAENVAYGANLFYYLRHDPATGFSTFGTISSDGTTTDRFGVGPYFDALTFVPEDVGYGPNLFYYLRHDPGTGFSTFGTISTNGTVTDRFGVGFDFRALAFADTDVGYGTNRFYYLRSDPLAASFTTFGTISTNGDVTDRFGVGNDFDALAFPRPLRISIDVKPGVFPNTVNPASKGKVPVAILSTAAFDATTMIPASVRFGAIGTEASAVHSAIADVNADGRNDLILQFMISETGVVCGSTTGILTGTAGGNVAIRGSDPIVTTGCN